VHFLFGLIFKYDAPFEQEHRSQGPNEVGLLGWQSVADDAARIFLEIARVLRPGGRLIIGKLATWSIWASLGPGDSRAPTLCGG
jgi:SAM-dependent methyltransferase